MSWGWLKLLQRRDFVRPFFWVKLGNGQSTLMCWFLITDGDGLNLGLLKLWFGILFPPPLNLDVNSLDIPYWRDLNGVMSNFSISRAWEAFRPCGNEVHWFRIVWFPYSIPHHSFHLWLVMWNSLKTQDKLRQWDVGINTDLNLLWCPLCNTQKDSYAHLFFECSFSSQVWKLVRHLASMETVQPVLQDIIVHLQSMAHKRTPRSIFGKLILAPSYYYVCLERNNRLFKKTKQSPEELRDVIMVTVRLKLLSFRFKNSVDMLYNSDLNITAGHPNGAIAKIRKDLKRENVLGTGSEVGGLYMFNTESLWHNRLGHPLSEHKVIALGELIHLDLWGPYKVPTIDGFSLSSHKTFFDDFETGDQTSRPNDDGREPSSSNTSSSFDSNDIAEEQSFDDDQGSVQIGKEILSEGNVPENNNVPTYFFNTKASSCVRRSSRQSKLLAKLNDYVLNSKVKYKARLIAKGYNQREGIDYEETFSPVVKMGTIRCLISLVQNNWNLFQLDVNNAFLYGSLDEDWNNKLPEALIASGFKQSGHDHSLYTKEFGGKFVALLVYVDDIVFTENDVKEIDAVKTFLSSKFKIKDLGELKYFLGIEVLKTKKGWCSRICVEYEKSEHMSLKIYADSDWAKCHVTRRSISGYYVSIAAATCEVMWIVNILKDLKVTNLLPTELYCDNSASIQIDANPVMHEKTKHFDLDVHIIREKVASRLIKTAKMDSENQITDIFTKALGFPQHSFLMLERSSEEAGRVKTIQGPEVSRCSGDLEQQRSERVGLINVGQGSSHDVRKLLLAWKKRKRCAARMLDGCYRNMPNDSKQPVSKTGKKQED
ncbi:ribonuclease H-like domain-containing protein [Tanacetum coccineum]